MGGKVAKSVRAVPDSFGVFTIRLHQQALAMSTLHADAAVLDKIRTLMHVHFPGGNEQKVHCTTVVFKLPPKLLLKGRLCENDSVFLFFCDLLESLSTIGYFLVCAPDLFLSLEDPEIMFYRMLDMKASQSVFCVKILGDDRVQVLHADADTTQLLDRIIKGRDAKVTDQNNGTYLINGDPWKQMKVQSKIGPALLVDLFTTLGAAGYKLMGSICLNGEQDTMFFAKDEEPLEPPEFAMLLPSKTNSLIAFRSPDDIKETVRNAIKRDWDKGLKQETQMSNQMHEFELNGDIWTTSANYVDPTASQRFMLSLMERLRANGWRLVAALDWSASVDDKSAFVFTRVNPDRSTMLAVQPIGRNRLAVVSAPDDIADVIDKILNSLIGQDAIKSKVKMADGSQMYELVGAPWFPKENEDCLLARHVISVIVAALLSRSWRVVCACDIQGDVRTQTTKTHMSTTTTANQKEYTVAGVVRVDVTGAKGVAQKRQQKVYESVSKNEQFDVSTIIFEL